MNAVTQSQDIAGSYDALPYDSYAFAQTHPTHLRTVAALFGLSAPPLVGARVLEIGCAAGGNLWPMAWRNPQAQFVGIDLSPAQIKDGQSVAARLGLQNLQLIEGSVTELPSNLGQFDYILCHGVYSWVPPDVQSAILAACSRHLTPQGIAYVSYNTYPGWKGREVARDAMRFRAQQRGGDIQEQLNYALGMVDFMADHARAPLVKHNMAEIQAMFKTAGRSYIGHEFLEIFNSPCYFSDFAARAHAHGLAYLSEAEPHTIYLSNMPVNLQQQLLAECGGDQIVLEQYMDYLNNRSFRQTLLVHQSQKSKINYDTPEAVWLNLHYRGTYQAQADGALFTTAYGGSAALPLPWQRAVAAALTAASPGALAAKDLLATAQTVDPGVSRSDLVALLSAHVQSGALRATIEPPSCAGHAAAGGTLDGYASAYISRVTDAEKANQLTNVWHEHRQFVLPYVQALATAVAAGSADITSALAAAGYDARLLYQHGLMRSN